MAKKKTMIVLLLVLVALCGALSLVQVPPAVSNPAKLWITAEANVLHARNQAVHYYQAVRLIYDLARQLQALQDQEHALQPAVRSGEADDCPMHSPTSFKKAVPERQGWKLVLDTESGQVPNPTVSTSQLKAVLSLCPRRDFPIAGLRGTDHSVQLAWKRKTSAILRVARPPAVSRIAWITVVDAQPSSLECDLHFALTPVGDEDGEFMPTFSRLEAKYGAFQVNGW